jgi:polar amino acid transport system substrate-binding protein
MERNVGAIRFFLIMVVFGFFLPPTSGAETKSLTLVYPEEKNAFHEAAAAIIREAYDKLGVQVAYKTYPAERALRISNQGRADGELVRIEGVDIKYTNLIRIPVSHVQAKQMAFGKRGNIKINGWESLKPYKIVFHRGYKVAEQNTIGMNRFIVGSDRSAFLMVEKGRMDVAVANLFTGQKLIEELKLKKTIMLSPPVQVDPLFHYLHRKHESLVPNVTARLRTMKKSGRFEEIKKNSGLNDL